MSTDNCPPFCDCDEPDDLTDCECRLTDEQNERLDQAQRHDEQRGA